MRFRNITLNIGTHRLQLYMSSHDWVNDHEAETYVATFAQSAAESVLSDEDWEEDNTEVTTDIQEMPEDDFLSITLMDSHVRPVLGIYRLDDPTSSLMTLYRDFGKDVSDEQIQKLIKKAIAEMNVQLPSYKRVKRFVVRSEEFVKTTTKKIKRFKNMGDASARDMSAMEDEDK